MITITSFAKLKNPEQYDHVYAIVRSLKNKSRHIEQVDALSPSLFLLNKYLDLKKNGLWNQQAFQEQYVPAFLIQMHCPEAVKWLNRLYQMDKNGQNIALICFCPNPALCHRSIIAGLLAGVGCQIQTDGFLPDTSYLTRYQT